MYKNIFKKFRDGIILGIGFIFIIGIVNAFTSISNVNTGDTLSADLFNKIINNQAELQNSKQSRINGNCAAGSAIKTVNTDGTVICETRLQGPKGSTGRTGPQGPAGTFTAPVYFSTTISRASNLGYTVNDNRDCDLYCRVVKGYLHGLAARIIRANSGGSNLCGCFN